LFNGITSDLFKDVAPPKVDYDILINKIADIFNERNITLNQFAQ
jgi:hypothetical protein